MNEEMKLILEANRLILSDRKWNNGDCKGKAVVIDNKTTEEYIKAAKEHFPKKDDDVKSELNEVKG
jgi:hypothetical protein